MHAKNSEKVPVMKFLRSRRKYGNTRLEFREGTCNDERRRRAKFLRPF